MSHLSNSIVVRGLTLGLAVAGVIGGVAGSAQAARVALDNAGNYSSWANGSNQGSGFGPWSLGGTTGTVGGSGYNSAFHGVFLGNSNGNGGNAGPGINTAGQAWGFYANTSNTQNNVRPFTADSLGNTALTAGQTLRFRIDNGFIQNSASVGVSLQTAGGANRFELFFGGGDNVYRIADATANNVSTGLAFTDGGLDVALTQTTSSQYTVTVTRLAGGSPSSVTRTANLIGSPGAFDIAQIRFFNFSAGSGGANNAFANSISITKPVTQLTSGAAAVGYGSSLGSLTVTGSNGNYSLQQLTGLSAERGSVQVSGFNPATDTQIYGLRLVDTLGAALSPANLTSLASAIGANASTVNPGPFPSSYNLFVTYSGLSPMPNFAAFDFSTAAQSAVTTGVRISAIAVIPEPSVAAVVGLAGLPMLRRRRV